MMPPVRRNGIETIARMLQKYPRIWRASGPACEATASAHFGQANAAPAAAAKKRSAKDRRERSRRTGRFTARAGTA